MLFVSTSSPPDVREGPLPDQVLVCAAAAAPHMDNNIN